MREVQTNLANEEIKVIIKEVSEKLNESINSVKLIDFVINRRDAIKHQLDILRSLNAQMNIIIDNKSEELKEIEEVIKFMDKR